MGFLAGLIASGVGVFLKVLAWLKSRNDAAAQHDRGVQAEEVAKNQGAVLKEVSEAKEAQEQVASEQRIHPDTIFSDDGYRRD